jgi:hypothetical protein
MRRTVKCLVALVFLMSVQACTIFDAFGVAYYIGTTEQRKITAALSQFSDSVVVGDFEKAANLFDENGEFSVDGKETIVGKANILSHLKSIDANRVVVYDFKQSSIELPHEGFRQIGTYRRIAVTADGTANTVEGRFIAEWVIRPAGFLLMHRLHMSPTVVAN